MSPRREGSPAGRRRRGLLRLKSGGEPSRREHPFVGICFSPAAGKFPREGTAHTFRTRKKEKQKIKMFFGIGESRFFFFPALAPPLCDMTSRKKDVQLRAEQEQHDTAVDPDHQDHEDSECAVQVE